MRFIKILFLKHRYIALLLLCVFLTGVIRAQEKAQGKGKMVTVKLMVVDEESTPVSKAKVVVGEGVIHAETDNIGSLTINAYPSDFVTISATGYERSVLLVQDIMKEGTVKLTKSKLFMSFDDNVSLPYMTLKKRTLTGSYQVLKGEQLEKYPSSDLRNALAGLATGLQVIELNGAPGLNAEEQNITYRITEKVRVSSRGFNIIYMVDDVPVDITEIHIDPLEIESVTVIKDIV